LSTGKEEEKSKSSKHIMRADSLLYLLTNVVNAVAIAFTVVSWIFVCYFRNKPIVAMAQPPMLAMLCFGVLVFVTGGILMAIVRYPRSNPNTTMDSFNIYCMLSIFFTWVGYFTIMTTLMCKLYRVYKVMQFRRGQKILARHVLGPFLLTMLVAVGACIALEITYPSDYEFLDIETETYGYCSQFDTYLILQNVLEFPIQIAILVFAWKLRNVNEEIGESRRIFHLSCLYIGITIIRLSIISLVDIYDVFRLEQKLKIYVVTVLGMLYSFLFMTASIGFLILPRMYYVRYEYVHGHLPENIAMIGRGQVRVTPVIKPTAAIHRTTTATATTTTERSTAIANMPTMSAPSTVHIPEEVNNDCKEETIEIDAV